ncbi:hypothetical protein KM043_014713 [Ampulex compressa]|nr:hypothetical protein KM043_014713 [Ampulex compressa]
MQKILRRVLFPIFPRTFVLESRCAGFAGIRGHADDVKLVPVTTFANRSRTTNPEENGAKPYKKIACRARGTHGEGCRNNRTMLDNEGKVSNGTPDDAFHQEPRRFSIRKKPLSGTEAAFEPEIGRFPNRKQREVSKGKLEEGRFLTAIKIVFYEAFQRPAGFFNEEEVACREKRIHLPTVNNTGFPVEDKMAAKWKQDGCQEETRWPSTGSKMVARKKQDAFREKAQGTACFAVASKMVSRRKRGGHSGRLRDKPNLTVREG